MIAPLRVSVNLSVPAALNESHIAKGWPETFVIDAHAKPDPERPNFNPQLGYQEAKGKARKPFGRYISHRLGFEGADANFYPPTSLPLSAHPREDTVVHGGRTWPDLRRREVRLRAAMKIADELKARRSPIVLHDNLENWRVSGPAATPHPFSVEDQCFYLEDVQERVGREITIVANWTGGSAWYTDDEVDMIARATSGFNAEVGIDPKLRDTEAEMRRQVTVYRQMNRLGCLVVLQAVNGGLEAEVKAANPTATPEQLKTLVDAAKAAESEYTAFFAYMAREIFQVESDDYDYIPKTIYRDHPFWMNSPPWQALPDRLGLPVDEILYEPTGGMSRTFEGGWLWIGPPRQTKVVWASS